MSERSLGEIESNVRRIREKIAAAAAVSGRKPEEIVLVGVSKTVGEDMVLAASQAGITQFGENRVQELLKKADNMNNDVQWHLIGRLQTNKVKYLDSRIVLIHSLDRMELAQSLQERGAKTNRIWPVLVQINVSGEESKAGISPEELLPFLKTLSGMGNIKVKGLMTVAPYSEDPEAIRWVFRDLRKLFIDTDRERVENINMEYLSMGMSNDYEIAIEEGANMVRIGSAIFGERIYK